MTRINTKKNNRYQFVWNDWVDHMGQACRVVWRFSGSLRHFHKKLCSWIYLYLWESDRLTSMGPPQVINGSQQQLMVCAVTLGFKNHDTRTRGFIYCIRINTGETSCWGCTMVKCSSSILKTMHMASIQGRTHGILELVSLICHANPCKTLTRVA